MSRREFAQKIAARAGVPPSDAEAVLEALVEMAREHGLDATLQQAVGLDEDETTEVVFVDADAKPPRAAPEMPGQPGQVPAPMSRVPTDREIQALIEDATRHPLGLDFLLNGELGAVAITFRTHAFAVEAARQYLRDHAAAGGLVV